jgi:predicted nuclease with TOPRIM domain
MTDTDTRITELQERIDRLEAEQNLLREKLTEAQVEQWQGRIDDIELQAHLASMDANDRVSAVRRELQEQWQAARARLAQPQHKASDVIETVRDGLDGTIRNLREAMVDARHKSTARN